MSDVLAPAALALWVVLAHAAWQRQALPHALTALPQALLAGAGLGLLAWLGGPPGSAALAPGLGLAAAAFAWPLLALRQARRPGARRRAYAPREPAHSGSFGR
ncbi:MAG: hypothetical protein JNM08_08725 [Rubrivivax sp.]|nr:hypothetical protein [Rubrivivax sp.]